MKRQPRLWILAGILASTACSRGAESPGGGGSMPLPEGPPYIRGVVTSVQPREIRVEEDPRAAAGTAKAVLRLAAKTRLLRRSGAPAEHEELRPGILVSAWVSGPIMESYPVQATADVVVIETASP